MNHRLSQFALLVLTLSLTGCSLRTIAITKIADSIAAGGSTYASDDDPELIAQATPFSLKLIESLLAETPSHRGLLLSAASGYTQYAYAFVHLEGDRLAPDDFEEASFLYGRAGRLYLRARDYGLRGLDAAHAGFSQRLRSDPSVAVAELARSDVPIAYWTAVAWGAAISVSKTNPDLIADQQVVEALIDRALELDEAFDDGAIHAFLISYEQARQGAEGNATERGRRHFDRAVALSRGGLASPYVAFAESVSVANQNRDEFEELLRSALAIDPNARVESRLANIVSQRRAQWLLDHTDELFVSQEVEP